MLKKFFLSVFIVSSGLSSAWAPLTFKKIGGAEARCFSDSGIVMPYTSEGKPFVFERMVEDSRRRSKVYGVSGKRATRFIDGGKENVSLSDGHLVLMVQKQPSMALNQFKGLGGFFGQLFRAAKAAQGNGSFQIKADIFAVPVWVVSTGEDEAKQSRVFLKSFLPENADFPKEKEKGHGILYDARFSGAAWGNASSDAAVNTNACLRLPVLDLEHGILYDARFSGAAWGNASSDAAVNTNACSRFPVLDLDGRENGAQNLKAHLCSDDAERILWFGETYKEEAAGNM